MDNVKDKELETKTHYTIGEFTFNSFHDYRDAQEDIKKIEVINSRLDIHDPEAAVRLYNMIRNGEITFRSPIGEQFFDHVADIVAHGSEDLLEDKAVVEVAEGKVKYQRLLGIAVATFGVLLFAFFAVNEAYNLYETRQIAKVQNSVEQKDEGANKTYTTGSSSAKDKANERIDTSVPEDEEDVENANEPEHDPYRHEQILDPATMTVLPEYAELHAQNEELVGWITIPGTNIDYPVMQREDDNEYYLRRAFDGSNLTAGTLFADYRCDIVNPTTNTIIYGHNMRNETMFGNLDNYLDSDYYTAHRSVTFNTIYEYRTYEIVAVCLSEVEYQDVGGYRYYNFIQAGNRAEWDAFVNHVNNLSVYDGPVDLRSDSPEEVLTLSTCNDYVQDGRLFLVAKRIG